MPESRIPNWPSSVSPCPRLPCTPKYCSRPSYALGALVPPPIALSVKTAQRLVADGAVDTLNRKGRTSAGSSENALSALWRLATTTAASQVARGIGIIGPPGLSEVLRLHGTPKGMSCSYTTAPPSRPRHLRVS